MSVPGLETRIILKLFLSLYGYAHAQNTLEFYIKMRMIYKCAILFCKSFPTVKFELTQSDCVFIGSLLCNPQGSLPKFLHGVKKINEQQE